MKKSQQLTKQLRQLTTTTLARVSGGYETASTSTSGRPGSGDDTIGDQVISDLDRDDDGGDTIML